MKTNFISSQVLFFYRQIFYPAIVLIILLTIITGLAYPLLVTGIAQTVFSEKANGNLIWENGQVVGSRLIGQHFSNPKYFWGRPSATLPYSYNATASSGSNLGPTNPKLIENVKKRITMLKEVDPDNIAPIPIDLVTSSASGLDPHISRAAADYQVKRIARIRQLSEIQIQNLVEEHTTAITMKFLGEAIVNVLELNLALDNIDTNNVLATKVSTH